MTARRSGLRPGRLRGAGATGRAALARVGALAGAEAAAFALRPRSGLIAPDPVALEDHFAAAEVARARAYGRPQFALAQAGSLIEAAVLAGVVARPPRALRDSRSAAARNPLAGAAATGAMLSAALTLASLPVRAIARRRAVAAGLDTQGWGDWTRDIVKANAIGTTFAAAAATAAVALMRRQPRWWWLSAAGVIGAAGPVLTLFAPIVLDPIFNRFEPLPEGEARTDVLDLARAAGVRVGEVFEVDASRRTTAANAYVTGVGPTKRVVLFDTLLSSFTRDEARLVVAHELAHVRHRDVSRGLLYGALVAPATMHAAAALARWLDGGRGAWRGAPAGGRFALAGGRSAPAGPAALPALALSLGIVGGLTRIPACQLSRGAELRADAFSLRLTDATEPFISFRKRIVVQNLIDPAPPRAVVVLAHTHPPLLTRIGIATAYARGVR